MDPVINSVLQSPLARNLNHIATDSTQFTYHVEQNAPPLSLKKGYIDSSQSFVGFDNTYTFTLPQWGYLAKSILRVQYQIKPTQLTHVTPVLPLYHMIDKVELMSHNNVIETLYGDSIMIKHAYYSESCCAATKMMGTLNVPIESQTYVDIAALFKNKNDGTPFNPFDCRQWNSDTHARTVTLFLELPFSFTDNPAMYFDTRFVEYLTVQVKLSSIKHNQPLFQAACAVEFDMGDENIQLDPRKHKNNITHKAQDSSDNAQIQQAQASNLSTELENKVAPLNSDKTEIGYSSPVQGATCFYYRPYFSRCIGTGGRGFNCQDYRDGAYADHTGSFGGVHSAQTLEISRANPGLDSSSEAIPYVDDLHACAADGGGCDPFELQLGARPNSRVASYVPVWMEGYYPSVDKDGIYACAHAGTPRYLRIGACNYDSAHYTVGYWGYLASGETEAQTTQFGCNEAGLNLDLTLGDLANHIGTEANRDTGSNSTSAPTTTTPTPLTTITAAGVGMYCDANIREFAATWAALGGKFKYSLKLYGTKVAEDVEAALFNQDSQDVVTLGTNKGDNGCSSTQLYHVNVNTEYALLERFYAIFPYLNTSNIPTNTVDAFAWTGSAERSNSAAHGHGNILQKPLIEGGQNGGAYGVPEARSVTVKLLVTYLSLHDRVREQVSMDNFKDNMPATILMHDTFQEYNGLLYGDASSPWATDTDQTMVVPIRSKNLAYAISIIAYRNKTNKSLVGGDVYNKLYDGSNPYKSKMDVSMSELSMNSGRERACPYTSIVDTAGRLQGTNNDVPNVRQIENHLDGDLFPKDRITHVGKFAPTRAGTGTPKFIALSKDNTAMTRWNNRKDKYIFSGVPGGTTTNPTADPPVTTLATDGKTEVIDSVEGSYARPDNGATIATDQGKGPCVLSDASFVWPSYKVVENFKTVKPTHAKLSIAGQTVYETAQQTALANSYFSNSSDSYIGTKGAGQWYVEKDLDNLPYHYNQGTNTRGEMGSVSRLSNIIGQSPLAGSLSEHCDAHVITFGLNKTDQLSNNGALGLSSATNAQLELKFAEPCRVSIYVHYHATLQIDSNTGVMSRSLDV